MSPDFLYYSKNLAKFNKLLDGFNEHDKRQIQLALSLAIKYHHGQPREESDAEGAGYVIHPLRVAVWLLEHDCRDYEVICAGLMHDLLEDTEIDPEDIKSKFNERVFTLVDNLTRPRDPDESEEEKVINKPIHFKKILHSDSQTIFIKAADMVDNISSWSYITPKSPMYFKFPRWFKEADELYLPIISKYSKNEAEEIEKLIEKIKIQYEYNSAKIINQ